MSSTRAVLPGNQEPRVKHEPRRSGKWTDGDDACFLAASYGLTADPWQEAIVSSWLGRKADGKLAAGRCGLSVPRQNGKNAILEIIELFKLVVLGRKILHTAHEVKTARKAFLRLKAFFENQRRWPELAAMVAPGGIRQTNGQEAIVLTNGGSIEFVARSRGSGRGFTVDDLVLDEAQELTDEQLEALLPTISAAPSGDPQIIMTGTPPPPNADGAPFRRMRTAGVEGKDKRLAWHEWSPESMPDPTDHEAMLSCAAATNPALGVRLQLTVVEDELAQMSFEGFMRERCGAWDADVLGGVVDYPTWLGLAIPKDQVPQAGSLAYAVKFSVDGERVSMAVGIRPTEGPVHVESFGVRPLLEGIAQIVPWLAARWRKASVIVLDGKAGTGDLFAALIAAGVPRRRIHIVTTDEAITAHAGMLRAIDEGTLSHTAQPGLDAQVLIAGKRKIGNAGGWGWQAVTPDGDVTAFDGVTLARDAVTSARRRTGTGEAVFA